MENKILVLQTFPPNALFSSFSDSGGKNAGVPAVFDNKISSPLNSLLTPKSAICKNKVLYIHSQTTICVFLSVCVCVCMYVCVH